MASESKKKPEERCPECGRALKPGMWPWCGGRPGDHDGKPTYSFGGDFR